MTGTRSRVWLWVAGGVTAVLCVGCVVVWEIMPIRWSSPSPALTCALPTTLPPQPTASTAPSGGTVRVVEQGYTQIDKVVSIGAMVENTSGMVAYQTPVRVRVLDAGGMSAVPPRSGEMLSLVIPVLMPGERIGVGTWSYLITFVTAEAVQVASVEIVLGPPQWRLPGDPTVQFGSVVATHVRDWRFDGDLGYGGFGYTVDSPYCRDVPNRGVAIVFRNSGGAIIGGYIDTRASSADCRADPTPTSGYVGVRVPAGIDGSKITVYPYCDPVPRRLDPLATERPAN